MVWARFSGGKVWVKASGWMVWMGLLVTGLF
jgi:hypothetical protein